MKQTDFRDVPDELWERIEPLLAPFKRKRSGGRNRLRSARFWQESSTNAGQDANGPCFPPAMDQKALSTSTSSDGTKPASWRRFFASFLLNMGKRSASTPNGRLWTAPCCKPRRALKKSVAEGLEETPQTEEEAAANFICMWMAEGYRWQLWL